MKLWLVASAADGPSTGSSPGWQDVTHQTRQDHKSRSIIRKLRVPLILIGWLGCRQRADGQESTIQRLMESNLVDVWDESEGSRSRWSLQGFNHWLQQRSILHLQETPFNSGVSTEGLSLTRFVLSFLADWLEGEIIFLLVCRNTCHITADKSLPFSHIPPLVKALLIFPLKSSIFCPKAPYLNLTISPEKAKVIMAFLKKREKRKGNYSGHFFCQLFSRCQSFVSAQGVSTGFKAQQQELWWYKVNWVGHLHHDKVLQFLVEIMRHLIWSRTVWVKGREKDITRNLAVLTTSLLSDGQNQLRTNCGGQLIISQLASIRAQEPSLAIKNQKAQGSRFNDPVISAGFTADSLSSSASPKQKVPPLSMSRGAAAKFIKTRKQKLKE